MWREVGIPAVLSWNLGQPAVADRVIREELIDVVFLSRPALANPHWPVWAAPELAHPDPFFLLPQDWSWWLRNRPGSEDSHGLPPRGRGWALRLQKRSLPEHLPRRLVAP